MQAAQTNLPHSSASNQAPSASAPKQANPPPMQQTQNKSRSWIIKGVVIAFAVVWMGLIAASWADAAENDEYNFNWLDPEKKIYVLQNRRYTKAGRPLLSVMAGPSFGSSYRTSYNIDPRASYYFTESLGLEVFYSFLTNSENSTFDALKAAAPLSLPEVREIRAQYGLLFKWVPWYAKINVFNNILYFDWYFSIGAGSITTAVDQRQNAAAASDFATENLFAFYWGTGHLYHLSNRFVVRLDYTMAVYSAEYIRSSSDTTLFSNSNLGLGLGVKF